MPEVQLTNPGGGVLGGDRLELTASLGAGARATLCTQGATKIYRGAAAEQRARLSIGADALLEYLPHHVIPYAGSRWRQATVFDLAHDALLIAWEAFSAGRVVRGERFAFDQLASRTLVLRGGMPEAIEGCELASGGEPFAGYSYLATAYVVAPHRLDRLADELHDSLAGAPRTFASASTPVPGLVAARLLAADAPALMHALTATRSTARAALGLPPAPREVV